MRDPFAVYPELLSSAWREARQRIEALSASPTERFAEYRGREVEFMREVLGERVVWAGQRAQIESFFRRRFTTIRAARKASKTKTNALCIVAAVNLYDCKVISLGPSHRQVEGQLWEEVHAIYRSARARGVELLGKLSNTSIKVGPQHGAIGFSTDKPDRAQGAHAGIVPPPVPEGVDLSELTREERDELDDRDLTAEQIEAIKREAATGSNESRRLYFILDEAAGIEQPIIDAVLGSCSSDLVHLMMTANPTLDIDEDHEFARSFLPGSEYHRIKIAPIETDDPVEYDEAFLSVPNWLVGPGWVEDCARKWGRDSSLFASYVAGNFASDKDGAQVIPLSLLIEAEGRKVDVDVGLHIGVDIAASEEGDRSVASLWMRGRHVAYHEWTGSNLMRSKEIIDDLRHRWSPFRDPIPPENVHVDCIGVGLGVVHRFEEDGLFVDGVDFGAAPVGDWPDLDDDVDFLNRRAELHWVLRRALQQGVAQIPRTLNGQPNPLYLEARWPLYEFHPQSGVTKIRIEEKKKIKKRHKRSPDHLDAALYAWSRSQAVAEFGLVG